MTVISPKIEPRHLRLAAVVYVRQSTPQQLQNNQESTRRQYESGRACAPDGLARDGGARDR